MKLYRIPVRLTMDYLASEKKIEQLAQKEGRLNSQADGQGDLQKDLEFRQQEIDLRYKQVRKVKDRAKGLRVDCTRRHEEYLALLEEKAGAEKANLCSRLSAKWIEDVKAEA